MIRVIIQDFDSQTETVIDNINQIEVPGFTHHSSGHTYQPSEYVLKLYGGAMQSTIRAIPAIALASSPSVLFDDIIRQDKKNV